VFSPLHWAAKGELSRSTRSAPACRFTGAALKALRALRETAPSQAADLLKAISIFPCDTQNRSLEAVGSEKDSGGIDAIFAQALERGTKRENACIILMRASERGALAALPEDGKAFFTFRVPCSEQRVMLGDDCEADVTTPLARMHCSLTLQLLRQLENTGESEMFDAYWAFA
jgi:hypothetical protein